MNHGNKKTIIFDIDETLVNNEIFPDNLNIIRKKIIFLKKHNYSFGICTNRPLEEFVYKIIDSYLIDDYVICEGGAVIYYRDNCITKVEEDINKIIRRKLDIFDIKYNLNMTRKRSCTIRIEDVFKIDYIIDYLKKLTFATDFYIEKQNNKILIHSKKIDKIKVLNEIYESRSVIFVTDYEEKLSKCNDNIKIYSVGINNKFNKTCYLVFSKSTKGVLEILEKEGKIYEQL